MCPINDTATIDSMHLLYMCITWTYVFLTSCAGVYEVTFLITTLASRTCVSSLWTFIIAPRDFFDSSLLVATDAGPRTGSMTHAQKRGVYGVYSHAEVYRATAHKPALRQQLRSNVQLCPDAMCLPEFGRCNPTASIQETLNYQSP